MVRMNTPPGGISADVPSDAREMPSTEATNALEPRRPFDPFKYNAITVPPGLRANLNGAPLPHLEDGTALQPDPSGSSHAEPANGPASTPAEESIPGVRLLPERRNAVWILIGSSVLVLLLGIGFASTRETSVTGPTPPSPLATSTPPAASVEPPYVEEPDLEPRVSPAAPRPSAKPTGAAAARSAYSPAPKRSTSRAKNSAPAPLASPDPSPPPSPKPSSVFDTIFGEPR